MQNPDYKAAITLLSYANPGLVIQDLIVEIKNRRDRRYEEVNKAMARLDNIKVQQLLAAARAVERCKLID